jgi:maleate cis-trans isomerase
MTRPRSTTTAAAGTAPAVNGWGIGVLYPGTSIAEDDFETIGARLHPQVLAHIAVTHVPGEGVSPAELKALGGKENLQVGVDRLRTISSLSSVMWACTSGSFLWGLEGTHRQAAFLTAALGVPASTTSLAIVNALHELDINKVAVASPYPEEITDHFVGFLKSAHLAVVSQTSLCGQSAAEIGRIDTADTIKLVGKTELTDAEGIIIPDTALHTVDVIDRLEDTYGRPVITANQATVWYALRLSGYASPQKSHGALLRHLP